MRFLYKNEGSECYRRGYQPSYQLAKLMTWVRFPSPAIYNLKIFQSLFKCLPRVPARVSFGWARF